MPPGRSISSAAFAVPSRRPSANYQAVTEDRADVTLTLLAEVARDYIDLRGAQRRIEVARKNLAIERDLVALTQSLLAAGLAPQQDLLRAEAQVSRHRGRDSRSLRPTSGRRLIG